MKTVIGIAAARKYEQYVAWFKPYGDVEVFKLNYELSNFDEVKRCHGIVMAGGEDVHPRRYHKPELVHEFQLDDMDESRDEFEWKILEYTQQNNLPVLGVCRGLQLTNVFFGGTLIPDIVSFDKPNHTRLSPTEDRHHTVIVKENTLLQEIVAIEEGEVNSSHHQSADILGEGLMVNIVSVDGVIEGLERIDKTDKPYLMLVQWHPERMRDQESPFSKNILKNFIHSVKAGAHANH